MDQDKRNPRLVDYAPNYKGTWNVIIYNKEVEKFSDLLNVYLLYIGVDSYSIPKLIKKVQKEDQVVVYTGSYENSKQSMEIAKTFTIQAEIDDSIWD